MPWRAACLPPDGVAGGNSPNGGDRGERESCKVRDGHPVAGANLAYRPFISFPEPVSSLTSSLIYSAIFSATHPGTQIGFAIFRYTL